MKVKCLAFPEHEHYARVADQARRPRHRGLLASGSAPFPYPEFTIAESYFGWNGNECGGLVMIDERVFSMPHLAEGYVEYLISHETCHQWFYNVVGTNGYNETFMDEAIVTYLSHRLLDQLEGQEQRPAATTRRSLSWLPGIKRENYRFSYLLHDPAERRPGPAVHGHGEVQEPDRAVRRGLRPGEQDRRHDRGPARAGRVPASSCAASTPSTTSASSPSPTSSASWRSTPGGSGTSSSRSG